MRVIAGELRSRKLIAPPGDGTRPTPDRLRESLFSILQLQIEDKVFYDLYAGSGSVGIEALSRGASRVVFVENDRAAIDALRQNLRALKIENRGLVVQKRAHSAIPNGISGIVFADPPYNMPKEYEHLVSALEDEGEDIELLLIQHDRRLPLQEKIGELIRYRELKQGDNVVSFYARELKREPKGD